MSYREQEFKGYFRNERGAAESSVNYYNSYLKRMDRILNGLDEAIAERGPNGLILWSNTETQPPFDKYRSDAKSVLKCYLQFRAASPLVGDELGTDFAPESPVTDITGAVFQLEREMQKAIRSQLDQLELGLVEADNGSELGVSTGRIDVLAKDKDGFDVVIELKVGTCPPGAIEQALGYASSLMEDHKSERVRVFIVAGDFSDRTRAAARRIPDLVLKRYRYSLQFEEVK